MYIGQVKTFLIGSAATGDVSLFIKILAALITGQLDYF